MRLNDFSRIRREQEQRSKFRRERHTECKFWSYSYRSRLTSGCENVFYRWDLVGSHVSHADQDHIGGALPDRERTFGETSRKFGYTERPIYKNYGRFRAYRGSFAHGSWARGLLTCQRMSFQSRQQVQLAMQVSKLLTAVGGLKLPLAKSRRRQLAGVAERRKGQT